tara:strand:- start:2903 stop:5059 length:2157 start_codon:yes stop_codon:yes gene_type:complete
MNRDVMQRQMFAKGGAAFPDLSGDGAVTQKDVLMGRGVLPMQGGGMVYPMQEGGMTPVDPMATMPVAAQPTMPLDTDAMDLNSAAQGAMQQGIDPAVLEGMLGDYSSQMNSLDNAEDYETVMNGIRGDEMPLEARYSELAEIVGPEDAQATPESVLALVQPVMQLAAVDQGIGGLVEDEMNTPIVGPMADGIMSTVNLGAPEGAAPVNFNQGGAVQYMAPGGVVPSRLQSSFDERQSLYNSIIGPQAYNQADLDAERDLTQAQMLFDVAGTALQFATPGERQMSPAQRLAQAATDTQLFEKIGARAREQMTTDRGRKKDMRDEKMQIDLMSLQAAEDQLAAEAKIDAAAAAARAAASRAPQVQQFMDKTTGSLSKFIVGTEGYYAAIDNPNLDVTGDATQTPPSNISYLTDPQRLEDYANKLLGNETVEFEQRLLSMIEPKITWDGERYVETAGAQLAPQVLEAVRLANPELYKQITKGGAERTPDAESEDKGPTNLNDATVSLFNADGTVNRDSKGWTLTEPNRFDPDIDYQEVIGASRIIPGIGKMLSEGAAEIFGGEANPEAQKIAKAATSLDALANDLLQFSTNQSDGRVLKFVQEKIEKEVANIRPGGVFLKTDADAKAAFETLTDTVARQLQLGARILPEYGGDTGAYTPQQVTGTREDMNQMKVFMNELLAFQEGFQFVPIGRTVFVGGQDQSLGTVKSQINQMRKQNNGE